ncbi:MAG: exonuclease domain-containing protein, partial [Actinomycetota bacterium]|nr:exonuclease domain-containing protein [Actinomycetota bacterium]
MHAADAGDLLARSVARAEFLCVDVETNGAPGDDCEVTEVGTVLVGGGELHDRWSSLVAARAPLSRAVQRLTGISQAMVDAAPPPERALVELERRLRVRV